MVTQLYDIISICFIICVSITLWFDLLITKVLSFDISFIHWYWICMKFLLFFCHHYLILLVLCFLLVFIHIFLSFFVHFFVFYTTSNNFLLVFFLESRFFNFMYFARFSLPYSTNLWSGSALGFYGLILLVCKFLLVFVSPNMILVPYIHIVSHYFYKLLQRAFLFSF